MLDFTHIVRAWKKLSTERENDLRERAPNFSNPQSIYIKRVSEDQSFLTIEFLGFEKAVDNPQYVPQVKNLVVEWLKKIRITVQLEPRGPDTLVVHISKEMRFGESVNINRPEKQDRKITNEAEMAPKYEQPEQLTQVLAVRIRGKSNDSERKF